jgi:hypothetical protein
MVVITSVTNCSTAIMTCLLSCDLRNGTATTNLTVLIKKDLLNGAGYKSVGAGTRRVAGDASA